MIKKFGRVALGLYSTGENTLPKCLYRCAQAGTVTNGCLEIIILKGFDRMTSAKLPTGSNRVAPNFCGRTPGFQ